MPTTLDAPTPSDPRLVVSSFWHFHEVSPVTAQVDRREAFNLCVVDAADFKEHLSNECSPAPSDVSPIA